MNTEEAGVSFTMNSPPRKTSATAVAISVRNFYVVAKIRYKNTDLFCARQVVLSSFSEISLKDDKKIFSASLKFGIVVGKYTKTKGHTKPMYPDMLIGQIHLH
jgi:hypothetical protein